jgi:hypothetical protein
MNVGWTLGREMGGIALISMMEGAYGLAGMDIGMRSCYIHGIGGAYHDGFR